MRVVPEWCVRIALKPYRVSWSTLWRLRLDTGIIMKLFSIPEEKRVGVPI
jgi:hypothetical protein|tara:strand:- start:122 stop:271 length:150 start_codon:yes stop_codon:yes gene_type:complete